MSDENGSAAKVGAWTTEAKLEFLMHVIAVTNDNKSIPWNRINIPGRTTKSLQNMWTKINKDLAEIKAANGNDEGTPTARKKSGKKVMEEDVSPTKTSTSKKRAAPAAKGSAKKAKKEESDSGIDDNVKTEDVDI